MGFLFSEASPKVKAQKDSFPVNTISAIMGKSDLDKGAKVGSFESGSNVPSNTPTYPDQRHKDDDQPFAVADGGVDDGNEPLRILHLPSPPSVIAVEHVEWRGVHGDDHHRVLVHRVLQGSQLL